MVRLPPLEVDPTGEVLSVQPRPSAPVAGVRRSEPDPLHQELLGDAQLLGEDPCAVEHRQGAWREEYDGADGGSLSGRKRSMVCSLRYPPWVPWSPSSSPIVAETRCLGGIGFRVLSGGDDGTCPPWLPLMDCTPSGRGSLGALPSSVGGPGNPRMRVLQDPTQAIQTLARLWPDPV